MKNAIPSQARLGRAGFQKAPITTSTRATTHSTNWILMTWWYPHRVSAKRHNHCCHVGCVLPLRVCSAAVRSPPGSPPVTTPPNTGWRSPT